MMNSKHTQSLLNKYLVPFLGVLLLSFLSFGCDSPSDSDDDENDIGMDESAFVGMQSIFADEIHELEHIDMPDPGVAVVWIEGETYTFEDQPSCRFNPGHSLTAGVETEVDDAENFWLYIHRLVEGGNFDEGDDYRFEQERTNVEIAYGESNNERGEIHWSQMDDEDPSWHVGEGEPPTIRAIEDGEVTVKGKLSGADQFTGEVEVAMNCENGWEEN